MRPKTFNFRAPLKIQFCYGPALILKGLVRASAVKYQLVEALLIVLLIFLIGGCSFQQMAVQLSLPLVEGQVRSIQEENDLVLAEKSIPASLKMMEGFLQSDPDNPQLLVNLAEGFCGYSFSFVEESDPERAVALYERGRDYAFRALENQSPSSRLKGLVQADLTPALAKISREQISPLYWLAQCWGSWLQLSLDNPRAFADVSKVESVMQRIIELDETYHYAGAHLMLGVFYGSRTKMLGGNPEQSKLHFARNMTLTEGKYLLTPYFYARTYAVQIQDRDLFEKSLREVIHAPANILPEQRLANEVAKQKSKIWLERTDDLF
jgi:hypothetical protein